MLLWLDGIVLAAILFFHQKFLAVCFDEDQASLQGVNVPAYYQLLLALVAISVVVLIQVVGAILVIAMLAIPAAIAGGFTTRLRRMMAIAVLLGCLFVICGLFASYQLNWPPGATIALIAALFYLLSLIIKRNNGR